MRSNFDEISFNRQSFNNPIKSELLALIQLLVETFKNFILTSFS